MSVVPKRKDHVTTRVRLDDKTEWVMAGLYHDVGDADSWAAIALRERITELVQQAAAPNIQGDAKNGRI